MANISEPTEEIVLRGEFHGQIFFEDTDFSGVVYHANYLKFFDRAREVLVGLETLKQLASEGIQYVVADANIVFHAPLRFGDHFTVHSTTTLGRSPVTAYEQYIMCGERKICSAKIKVVAVNPEGRPKRYSSEVIERFRKSI